MQNEEQNLNLDEKILAEFERLVLEGCSREEAKRLTRNLFGRSALGTGGRTRAAIHDIVTKSKVRQPKKAETKTETVTKAETETETETEEVPPSKEYSDLDYFQAAGCYEPSETQLKRFREALDNLDLRCTHEEVIEIAEAIFLGRSHPALPLPEGTSYPTEALPVPTLVELEAQATEAWKTLQEAGWEWAVIITEIHDSKLYPGSAEAGGWERYMRDRWDIRRAQAFNIVAWVHNEMTLLALPTLQPSLDPNVENLPAKDVPVGDLMKSWDQSHTIEEQSTAVDSSKSPERKAPTVPIHATERSSRTARSKPRPRKVRGKLTETDLNDLREEGKVVPVEGTTEVYARTEADRLVAEGTLSKIGGEYYKTGDQWFHFGKTEDNDALMATFESFLKARSGDTNFSDLLSRLAVLVNARYEATLAS
jgi:hypothetical protein